MDPTAAGSVAIHSSNPFGVAVLEKMSHDGGIYNLGGLATIDVPIPCPEILS